MGKQHWDFRQRPWRAPTTPMWKPKHLSFWPYSFQMVSIHAHKHSVTHWKKTDFGLFFFRWNLVRQNWSTVLQERCKLSVWVSGCQPWFNRPGPAQVGRQSGQMEEHLGRYCKAWKIPGLVPWCPQHGWMSWAVIWAPKASFPCGPSHSSNTRGRCLRDKQEITSQHFPFLSLKGSF